MITIDQFYDKHLKLWTVLFKDENGDQGGNAEYSQNKQKSQNIQIPAEIMDL